MANEFRIKNGFRSEGNSEVTGSLNVSNGVTGSFSGSFFGDGSGLTGITTYVDNLVTVGLPGSETDYFSIKSAVDSIVDATATNTYTVQVFPGIYIEDTITVPSYVAVKGDSSISTVVSASNPSASIFIMSDQSMIIDMQIQGSTAPSASAIIYSSPTTPQTNAIAYVENVRFGTNYTNAKVIGTGSNGNCILQCSNVKYGGFTELNKSFDVGFHVTRTGSAGIGRMQLRNVTSTNGGVAGSDNNQIFALSDAPNCAFIVNGCLLTRAAGSALGTGFKVYNGGNLRLTGVNFQRWDKGIWAPQTGSGPSIDAIALNFENCTTDVAIEHSGSTGKVQGTDNFLKTQISLSSSLYEVGQDPRRITVGTKGADFTSISASVAYITDSSDTNRYVIEVGPGRYTEKEIDLTGKPYVSIVGSSIQTTQIFPSSSNQHLIKMGINNEVSFLTLTNAPAGYSALYIDDIGDFAQAHKVSFYDCDMCVTVISRTQDTKFYGEYLDYNGVYSTGSFVSSSNGYQALASLENYYQFPIGATGLIANYAVGGVAEMDIYAAGLIGEGDATSVAIQLENGADLQGLGMDMPGWGSAVYIPNLANSSSFNIVGSMIHDSVNYDFEILHPSASCRFQGTADHSKITNASQNFFWTFLDETDGELDITRKLSVTFADGTHTDASTLIFEGSPMGVMSGGNITISGSLTITTAAGYGYLHNMGTEVFQRIDWADTNLTLSPNTDNYIFIDETATLTANAIQPPSAHNIILGRVVTNDTGIELVDNSPYFAAHMSNALSKFNRNALGPVFAQGCIVSEDITPRQLDVTAGLYYFGENEYDPTGGSAIAFTQYYQSGSGAFGWNKSSQTLVPNNVYNSGSALVAMSASYYTKHSLYTVGRGPDEEYFLVINPSQYATLVEAENAGLPAPPTYFSDGVVALASIYVQSGSANITQIQDIRPIIGFRAAGVNASSVHGNLLGLNADDHQQYLLVNGTRAMSGNLNMGGYNVTNATSISSTFTGSLQGTASWAVNATNSTTASYVAAAGNNNEIQYNKAGSFAATASFSFIHTSQSLQHGETTVASGLYSHAEGYITTAVGNYSHTEGSVTSTGGTNGYLATSVTAGTASLSASYGDIAFYFANGSYLYLDDTLYDYSYGTTAVVIDSASFDGASTLIFLQDPSITTTTAVVGDLDNAPVSWIGDQPYAAQHAHAEGTNSTALGQYSHAEGNSVFSIGLSSHAEGRGSCAAGNYSHAEGLNTRALGTYSHAEGRDTTTIGEASHAEGFSTRTIGLYSHAEGQSTIALGDYSHAEGLGTIASGSGQLVIGQYNQHGNTTSLFVIGAGANDSTRADVFRVSTTTVDVLGNLSVTSGITGSLQGTASFATSASYAATASYVNGMVVKSGVAKGNSFSGTPLIYTVTFATQFPGTYTVTVTGGDARSWTVQDVGPAGFKINSNSSVAITNDVFWQAIRTGEFNM